MATTNTSLDAAATERKARLAKLASLKRKQPTQDDESETHLNGKAAQGELAQHLSGRNFDFEAQGPRLGFENAPTEGKDTIESRAQELEDASRGKDRDEKLEEKPLDLFTLQPKRPNWDLKRDLAKKNDILNQRTDNAIARLVRERIEGLKPKEAKEPDPSQVNGDGLTGADLVEGIRMREKEEANDKKREHELEHED